jgi:probable O-glycosylation ligase (exosortase A-associated)
MRDLAFIASWVLLVPLALQGAHLGVLLWAWTSLLAPNDVLYGMGASLPYGKISALLTFALLLFGRGGGMKMRWDATVLLMLALALSALVSQMMGLTAEAASGWDLYQKYVKILLLAVVVTAVMRDRMRLHALLLVICLGIGFTGLGEGAKFLLSGGGHKVEGTPSTGDNNQIGLDVLMILPMMFYLHATAHRRMLRLVCVAVGIMCAICIIATASRAAFVGLVVLSILFVVGSRRKVPGLVFIALLALGGAQLVGHAWVARMNTIDNAENDDSFLGRVGAWKVSTVLALHNPMFGGGMHAIQHYDVWTTYLPEAQQLDWFGTPPPRDIHAAHSIYFEILGDLGFVGLFLFLALFAVALRNAIAVRRMVRRSRRPDLAWAATLAGALQASTIVFLIGGASLSAAYYDIDYLIVAILAVLRDMVERALREPAPIPVAAPVPVRGQRALPEPVSWRA